MSVYVKKYYMGKLIVLPGSRVIFRSGYREDGELSFAFLEIVNHML